LAEQEDKDHLQNLGVVEFMDDNFKVRAIREKPHQPPSPYAVTGIYFYDPSVFEVVTNLKPSGRGELEITDVNNYFILRDEIEYNIIDGFWGDAGESIDYYYKVNDFVRKNGVNKRLITEKIISRNGNEKSISNW
jgi:glucose-1-phosphate thymidylyltransferase